VTLVGAIVGGGVGGLLAFVFLTVILFFWLRRRLTKENPVEPFDVLQVIGPVESVFLVYLYVFLFDLFSYAICLPRFEHLFACPCSIGGANPLGPNPFPLG
jgi:hypothetical protein